MSEEKVKVIGMITINILEGNNIAITSTIEDQRAVRDILKTAEEMVIQQALETASRIEKEKNKSSLIHLNGNGIN